MKRIFLVILPLYLSFSVYSQVNESETWEELNNSFIEYYNAHDYTNAIIYAEKEIKQAKIEFGIKHKIYRASLNNLAIVYSNTGNYQKAELLFAKIVKISKTVLKKKEPDYSISLSNLANIEQAMGKYKYAETLYREVISIIKKEPEIDSLQYASAMLNIADLYREMGLYEKAKPLYNEALRLRKKISGDSDFGYATCLNGIAGLYEAVGYYEIAEQYYKSAIKIWGSVPELQDFNFLMGLDNLARLYQIMGYYDKAESIYTEVIEKRKETLGEKHPDYATSINGLAMVYDALGNYDKSEALYNDVLKIRRQVFGENNILYADALNNLATLNYNKGNFKEAENLYKEALKIARMKGTEENTSFPIYLNNLARLYITTGLNEKAEPILTEVLKIRKKMLGSSHPDYATTVYHLGILYQKLKNYSKAEQYFTESMGIRKKIFSEKHPVYSLSLINLAMLYFEKGEFQKAEPLFQKANENILHQINTTYSFLTEKEQQLFFNKVRFYFDIYFSYIIKRKTSNPSITEILSDNELALKGALLKSSVQMRENLLNNDNEYYINQFNLWLEARKYITIVSQLTIEERKNRGINLDSLIIKADEIEKQLTIESNSYREQMQQIKWKDIKNSLKPDEAAIEYINFRYHNGIEWTDSNIYVVLIIRNNSQFPEFIQLFEEKEIYKYLFGTYTSDSLRGIKIQNKQQENTIGPMNANIYNLVWKPMEPFLKDVKTVFITPSGQLNYLSYSGLKIDSINYLCDKYNIYYLLSNRDILKLKKDSVKTEFQNYSATIYGGADYNLSYDEIKANDTSKNDINFEVIKRSLPSDLIRNGTFDYLPGTKTEADNICNILKENKFNVSEFTGNQATEDRFKSLCGKSAPQIIHIATHGFSLKNQNINSDDDLDFSKTNKFKSSDNPLLRTGLLFSGGNNAWSGLEKPDDSEDGILTAYEVSNLNLANTKLVVLSACETGLGDIKNGEGVFGLQRAFKLAGVGKIIMSKWSVPDKETSELMQLFYAGWMSSMTIHDAFINAQKIIRNKYPFQPEKWAAFVLME